MQALPVQTVMDLKEQGMHVLFKYGLGDSIYVLMIVAETISRSLKACKISGPIV